MFTRLRQAGLMLPTLLAVAGLAVLFALGAWQLQRRAWKEGLIQEMAARAQQAPVSLAEVQQRRRSGANIEYTRVAISGRFLHDHEMHVWSPFPPVKGYLVFTPLVAEGGKVVWINRGAIPEQFKGPEVRAAGQIQGETKIIGAVRTPEPVATFTAKDDPVRNIWQRRDPLQRSPELAGTPGVDLASSPDFYLEAEAEPANPGGWPKGGVSRVSLANRHLEYAVTWFGLAATLLGVFIAFAITRLRLKAVTPDRHIG